MAGKREQRLCEHPAVRAMHNLAIKTANKFLSKNISNMLLKENDGENI